MTDKVTLQLDLDAAEFQKALKQVVGKTEDAGDEIGDNLTDGFEEGERAAKGFGNTIRGVAARADRQLLSVGSNLVKNFARIGTIAAGAVAAFGTAIFTREAIQNAAAQENAINRLNTQLAITGDFSEAASQDLQNFASSLQQSTAFGDELIISQLALAKSFGATNEQAKEIAEAATDLSASFGIDLESATRNAAKTLGGFAGELGEVIPELKELTTEQLQAGEGVRLLAERFRGAAQGEIKTFSGALAQFQNSFGDFTEEIGFFVTRSPLVIGFLNTATKLFAELGTEVKGFVGELQTTEGAQRGLDSIRSTLLTVARAFDVVSNVGSLFFNSLATGSAAVVAGLGTVGQAVSEVFRALGINTGFQDNLDRFADDARMTLESLSQDTQDSLTGLFDADITNATEDFLVKYQESVDRILATSDNLKNGLKSDSKETADSIDANAQQIAGTINNALVSAISQGALQISAVLTGTSAGFESFTGTVLNIIGDLAIQLGQTLISIGLGIEALRTSLLTLTGGAAIAAGFALVALGGVLKSFAGSAVASSVGGGGAGGGSFVPGQENPQDFSSSIAEEDERESQQSIQVVVQGDVLDSDESALRITQLLESSFNKQGTTITRGFA